MQQMFVECSVSARYWGEIIIMGEQMQFESQLWYLLTTWFELLVIDFSANLSLTKENMDICLISLMSELNEILYVKCQAVPGQRAQWMLVILKL